MADPIAPAMSTEDTFQNLYDAGAFEAPKPAEAQQEQAQEAPEKPVEARPEAETAEKPEGEDAPDESAEGEKDQRYDTLDDFLKGNEIDPDQFRGLKATVKIDGETRQVPLNDIIKSYQLEGHVNNKSMELSAQRERFEAEQKQIRDDMAARLQKTEDLANVALQTLNADFAQVNWNELRASDPGQYAALVADYQQRQSAIQSVLQHVQATRQEEAGRQSKTVADRVTAENQRLLEKRPDWSNPEAFAKDHDRVLSYARTLGFTDAELASMKDYRNSLQDHRIALVWDDAARYRELQAKAPAATKRVREAPKMMAKPGTRQNRDPQQVAQQQLRDRAMRNPRDQDAQAAYFETLA